jgi:hypothetical protein
VEAGSANPSLLLAEESVVPGRENGVGQSYQF